MIALDKLSVNITPNSFLAKQPSFRFRVGVPENKVNNFCPNSQEFINSFRIEAGERSSGAYYGDTIDPLQIYNGFLSLGLKSFLGRVEDSATSIRCTQTESPFLTLGNGVIHYVNGGTRFTHFDSILSSSYFYPAVKAFSFDVVLERLIKIWLSTEETNYNSRGNYKNFRPYLDTTGSAMLVRRMVNIYEHTPGELYCISFLNFLAHSPVSSFTISNVWFNKKCYDSKGEDNASFLRGYFRGGLPYTLAKLILGPLGFNINFQGDISLSLKVEDKTFTLPIPVRHIQNFYRLGLPSLNEMAIGSTVANIFPMNTYSSRVEVDYKILGMTYNPGSNKMLPPPANVLNKLPPLFKACVLGIIHYNGNNNPRQTVESSRVMLANKLLQEDGGSELGIEDTLKEEIRKIKLERTLGISVTGPSSALDITHHLKTRSIMDKLVFARS